MADPYLSEIRIMAFGFAPKGWAMANGQVLAIAQNAALFALIGTTYGGNGTSTFALPNLMSRVPIHMGTSPAGINYPEGASGGEENHTLLLAELPAHNHSFVGTATSANAVPTPAGNVLAGTGATNVYAAGLSSPVVLDSTSVLPAGGNQPHANIQPFLALNFCIALQGIFPTRS